MHYELQLQGGANRQKLVQADGGRIQLHGRHATLAQVQSAGQFGLGQSSCLAGCLQERRKLILVPRESPLSLLHLRTLTTLAEAGAIIAPAMPVFYTHPDSLNDAIDFVAGRVLDLGGIDNELLPRWGADA